ncbi:MAG: 30S ribosomal protein S4 [Candidatus Moranbacteria bacterium]|nr:30S ribosomal protein S4 [Candidatus Moranbacteria bacterium]
MTVCKKCRRAGMKLFLKGERCDLPVCSVTKRNYPPGQHGSKSKGRLTDYGMQLRVKQKLKHTYGIREKQLKNYFNKAKNKKGDLGEIILQELELRLDNVVYRSGLADSRRQARQIVSHGLLEISSKSVDIPSYQVKQGTEIKIKESKLQKPFLKEKFQKLKKQKSSVDWINLDIKNGIIKIIDIPSKNEIKGDRDIGLVIEYYSR